MAIVSMPAHRRPWWIRLRQRIGSRRMALGLMGLLWVGLGLGLPLEESGWNPDVAMPLWLIPAPVRMCMWIGSGLWAMVAAACDRGERWGWSGLFVMPALRTVTYLWSFLMWLVPGAPGGSLDAAFRSLQWGTLGLLVLLLSTWRMPHARG